MEINFELYKIFFVVANNKSISKGAEKLLISQPAVTQAIKNLEGQLGVTLFIRTKKGILLTTEGEELYNYIKEGMNYFINGTNKLLKLKNLEAGTIKIGASTSITENLLMPYIKEFHRLYPKVEIKIINELTDNLLKELRNGNIDIVIGSESFKKSKDLIFIPIKDIQYIFVSNKKETLTLEEILQNKLILQASPSVSRSVFNKFISDNNLCCNITMEVVSHKLVVEFVKNKMGIGYVVKDYVRQQLRHKELYEVKVSTRLPKRKIGYILRDGFTPSHAVKELVKIIKDT